MHFSTMELSIKPDIQFRGNVVPCSVAFHPTNDAILAVGHSRGVIEWDTKRQIPVSELVNEDYNDFRFSGVDKLMYNNDATQLITAAKNDIIIWNLNTKQHVVHYRIESLKGNEIMFGASGQLTLLLYKNRVKVMNTRTKQNVYEHVNIRPRTAAISSSGKFIAFVHEKTSSSVRANAMNTRTEETVDIGSGISSSGGGIPPVHDKTSSFVLDIYDVLRKTTMYSSCCDPWFDSSKPSTVLFSPDETCVAFTWDNTVRVFSVEEKKVKTQINFQNDCKSLPHLRYTPDSKYMIVMSPHGVIDVFNASTHELMYHMKGQDDVYTLMEVQNCRMVIKSSHKRKTKDVIRRRKSNSGEIKEYKRKVNVSSIELYTCNLPTLSNIASENQQPSDMSFIIDVPDNLPELILPVRSTLQEGGTLPRATQCSTEPMYGPNYPGSEENDYCSFEDMELQPFPFLQDETNAKKAKLTESELVELEDGQTCEGCLTTPADAQHDTMSKPTLDIALKRNLDPLEKPLVVEIDLKFTCFQWAEAHFKRAKLVFGLLELFETDLKSYDGLVFCLISFTALSLENQIKFVTDDVDVVIDLSGHQISIPKGMKRIFINTDFAFTNAEQIMKQIKHLKVQRNLCV